MGLRKGIQLGWVALVSILGVVLLQNEESSLRVLFDLPSLFTILTPVGTVALYASWKMGLSGAAIVKDLSIPTALLAAMMGAILILSWMDDPAMLLIAVSVLLLPLLYGGTLTMLGHFSSEDAETTDDTPNASGLDIGFCLGVYGLIFLITPVYNADEVIGVWMLFVNPSALLLSGLCVGTALIFARERKGWVEALSDGGFASSALSVVASIVLFFLAVGEPEKISSVLLFGCSGLCYGLVIHLSSYLIALKAGDVTKLNFGVKNWHLVELTSFFLFVFFAPPTLLEMFL